MEVESEVVCGRHFKEHKAGVGVLQGRAWEAFLAEEPHGRMLFLAPTHSASAGRAGTACFRRGAREEHQRQCDRRPHARNSGIQHQPHMGVFRRMHRVPFHFFNSNFRVFETATSDTKSK